jgi:hypothetical protein
MTAMKQGDVLKMTDDAEDFENAYEPARKSNRNKAVSNQRLHRKASRQAQQSERNAGRQSKELSRGFNNHRGIVKLSELQAIGQDLR